MVRLSRDRWYSSHSGSSFGRGPQPSPTRRLIYMVGMLLLIVVLMQRSTDPRQIEQVFSNLGLSFGPSSSQQAGDEAGDEAASAGSSTSFRTDEGPLLTSDLSLQPFQAMIWLSLLERAPPEVISCLYKATYAGQYTDPLSLAARNWIQTCQADIDQWKVEVPHLYESFHLDWDLWKRALERGELRRLGVNDQGAWLVRRDWELAIDRATMQQIFDATPWTESEKDVLGRMFQWAKDGFQLQDDMRPPLVTLDELIVQPDLYRGQVIRMHGKWEGIPELQRFTHPIFGDSDYYRCWLQPEMASRKLVSLYVRNLPGRLVGSTNQPEVMVEVTGVFVKKLPAEPSGGLSEPLLVCSQVQIDDPGHSNSEKEVSPVRQPLTPWELPRLKKPSKRQDMNGF